jgi:hypothetical protein
MFADFLRGLVRFVSLYVARPVLLLVEALLSSGYNVLFAWWLDSCTFKGRPSRFEREIQEEYAWLFEEYGARIVPMSRYRQVLDYVVATVSVDELLLPFVRGREEFHVFVAPSHAPHDRYNFGEAIQRNPSLSNGQLPTNL